MVYRVGRNGCYVPHVVGNVTLEHIVNRHRLRYAAPFRSRFPEDENVLGHDVGIVVTGLGLLNEAARTSHSASHFVPDYVLMELPAELRHPCGDHHRCWVVSTFMQDSANDNGAKPSGDSNSHHPRKDRFDPRQIIVKRSTKRAVRPPSMPDPIAVFGMNVVINGVPIRRRCHSERNRRRPDLCHTFRRLQDETVTVAVNLRTCCRQLRFCNPRVHSCQRYLWHIGARARFRPLGIQFQFLSLSRHRVSRMPRTVRLTGKPTPD